MLPLCPLDAGSTRSRPRLELCQFASPAPLVGLYLLTPIKKNPPCKPNLPGVVSFLERGVPFFHFLFFYFFIFYFLFFIFYFLFFIFLFFIFFFYFLFFIFSFFYFLFFIFLFFHFFIFLFFSFFFYFSFFLFFHFLFFYFFIFIFLFLVHPPTPPSFFLAIPHPPLPAFFFALPCPPFPKIFRRFPTLFRRCSPPIRSQDHLRKIWSHLAHDVSLMSFLSIFCIFGKSISRRKIFNNQSEAAVFRRFFRRFSEDALHQSEARKSVTSTSENLV